MDLQVTNYPETGRESDPECEDGIPASSLLPPRIPLEKPLNFIWLPRQRPYAPLSTPRHVC